ncbi:hypothetical protein VTN77DRAFT_1720 [Rasamsonia byssochlamydoides]|uniref:uncharacterized protein n=1 Tax=Rasamsonia byssochlamydoides TaxID=89139 RepID=UPI003743132B
MHLSRFWLLALGAAAVEGFKDTSPFVFASTSEFPTSSSHLKSATSLFGDVWSKLKTCPSDYYIIASQPGVHATDYSSRKSAPRLREKATGKDKAIRSNFTVTEVVGILDAASIRDGLKDECGAHVTAIDASTGSYPLDFGTSPRVIDVTFPMLPLGSNRAQQLADNDAFLADIIDRVPSSKYTLVYVTSPREFVDDAEPDSPVYNLESGVFQEPLHMELKRDYAGHAREDGSDSSRSLFEEYQFLSPGIFMGLVAGFVFLAILYVGFSALTSLEVPYAAFEKDTAPGSQKKQQ